MSGEQLGEPIKKVLSDREGFKKLREALREADRQFHAECEKRELWEFQQILSNPWSDLEWFEEEIQKLPDGLNEEKIAGDLRTWIANEYRSLTSEQIQEGVKVYMDCLREALRPVEEYTLAVIGAAVKRVDQRTERIEDKEDLLLEISREILNKVKETTTAAPCFLVPFSRNDKFVGRQEDLEDLHAALQGSKAVGVQPAALTGMGGIGKTQLAVEYAYRFQDDYPGGVYWINAAQDWRSEFADRALALGLSAGDASRIRAPGTVGAAPSSTSSMTARMPW